MDTRLPTLPLAWVWALTALALAGCAPDAVDAPVDMFDHDPVVARALHDPLMIDPDLAGRSNAYSLIELSDGHPLPVFKATSEAAVRARSAARLELLEGGQIPDLPAPSSGSSGFALGQMARANAMVEAAAGPLYCTDLLEDDLIWSTRLSPATALPPQSPWHTHTPGREGPKGRPRPSPPPGGPAAAPGSAPPRPPGTAAPAC